MLCFFFAEVLKIFIFKMRYLWNRKLYTVEPRLNLVQIGRKID